MQVDEQEKYLYQLKEELKKVQEEKQKIDEYNKRQSNQKNQRHQQSSGVHIYQTIVLLTISFLLGWY